MDGESHYESLEKNENGQWVIISRDKENMGEPMIETTYEVSDEAVKGFDTFIRDKNILSLQNRKDSDEFITDYSSWNYSFTYDNSSIGGDSWEMYSLGQYKVYSDEDFKLLKELDKQFQDMHGKKLSEVVEKDDDYIEDDTEDDSTAGDAKDKEEGKNMPATLLYQGHGSVRIVTEDNKVIYIDPFMGDGYDLPADLILMTHGHYDHTQDSLISSRNTDCQTIKWTDALKGGTHQSFDLGYVKVEAVEAGYNRNHDASECVGFILTFSNGVKVYLSGDTSTTPTMPDLTDKEIDYAFICCDGVYNMDVAEASECAKVINAKHSIPYHMVPSNNSNGFDMSVAESFDAPGRIILQPGEELVLE
jgi:Predicted Zn-dependent hydrolases of the beta-lactamase fold